jgi:hypothetical protein
LSLSRLQDEGPGSHQIEPVTCDVFLVLGVILLVAILAILLLKKPAPAAAP